MRKTGRESKREGRKREKAAAGHGESRRLPKRIREKGERWIENRTGRERVGKEGEDR